MIKEFFDKITSTLTYVVWDQLTRDAVVIDPVLDCEEVINFVRQNELQLHWVLETHVHADHLSGSQIFKSEFPNIKIAIGSGIKEVQETFKNILNLPNGFKTDGSQFDKLLKDNEIIEAGSLKIETIFTPGHTPACVCYLISDNLFTGDALFMPDLGTGRCDFPAASAEQLFKSVHDRIYKLPDHIQIYVGHDYPKNRSLSFVSNIGEQKQKNIHIKVETTMQDFVKLRTERDKTLSPPKLMEPSIRANIEAGRPNFL